MSKGDFPGSGERAAPLPDPLPASGERGSDPDYEQSLVVPHALEWFAAVKLSLTAMGVAVLAACSRMKLFRAIPGEALLVIVLVGYAVLVAYELKLLERIS